MCPFSLFFSLFNFILALMVLSCGMHLKPLNGLALDNGKTHCSQALSKAFSSKKKKSHLKLLLQLAARIHYNFITRFSWYTKCSMYKIGSFLLRSKKVRRSSQPTSPNPISISSVSSIQRNQFHRISFIKILISMHITSNIASVRRSSNMALKPRAPVFFSIAFLAIILNAFSVTCNLT